MVLRDSLEPLAQIAPALYSEGFSQAVDHALRVRFEERTQSVGQMRAELGIDAHWDPPGSTTVFGSPVPPPANNCPGSTAPSSVSPTSGATTTAAATGS